MDVPPLAGAWKERSPLFATMWCCCERAASAAQLDDCNSAARVVEGGEEPAAAYAAGWMTIVRGGITRGRGAPAANNRNKRDRSLKSSCDIARADCVHRETHGLTSLQEVSSCLTLMQSLESSKFHPRRERADACRHRRLAVTCRSAGRRWIPRLSGGRCRNTHRQRRVPRSVHSPSRSPSLRWWRWCSSLPRWSRPRTRSTERRHVSETSPTPRLHLRHRGLHLRHRGQGDGGAAACGFADRGDDAQVL